MTEIDKVNEILRSLNDEERAYFYDGTEEDEDFEPDYRIVKYNMKNKSGGFIELFNIHPSKPNEGHIAIAVTPNSRGIGFSDLLVRRMVKKAKENNYKILCWHPRKGNLPSIKLAERCGFVEYYPVDRDTEHVYLRRFI